jgi:hypothetical protein
MNPWTAVCPIRDELSVVLAEVLGDDYRFDDMRPETIQTLQPAPGMCPVEGCRTVVFGLRSVLCRRIIDNDSWLILTPIPLDQNMLPLGHHAADRTNMPSTRSTIQSSEKTIMLV